MAKVYFYYSAMNAGKTTHLLQARYNYHERGMNTLCLKPNIDTRNGEDTISSRIGLSAPCLSVSKETELYTVISNNLFKAGTLACVFVDEAQFLTPDQVEEVCKACDILNIPILCYGLRTDFLGNPFPGSSALLARADTLMELKTVCFCGRKAIMNIRLDENGNPVTSGNQIQIGGNETYKSLCRRHFTLAHLGKTPYN